MELPEPVQFYLAVCNRISSQAIRDGIETLSSLERVVYRTYVFDYDEQNGGLSQFFYNTDSSPDVAEDTAHSLETIGAPMTAAVLRSVAAVICRTEANTFVGTWRGYLDRVDPDRRLDVCSQQIRQTGESVSDTLETFVIRHRPELEKPST